ncbi:hypothetical protein BG004_005876 [Podila humilis]|nr:hypothetical protein BG004_005876 [Podila humilis]
MSTTTTAPATTESFKSQFGRRLEPHLALSKSARGAACVQLIKDVLAAPGVMVFGELLDMPNVVDAIPYSDLMTYLEINNVRQLEDLIMDAIYQNVISASLDQKLKQVEVHSAMGRDLRPGQAQVMLKVLEDWTKTSEALLKALGAKMVEVQEDYVKEKQAKEKYEADLERLKKEASASGSGKQRKMGGANSGMNMGGMGMGGVGGMGGPHMMDTDIVDQHMFQSPEYAGEYERVNYGSSSTKRAGKRVTNRG